MVYWVLFLLRIGSAHISLSIHLAFITSLSAHTSNAGIESQKKHRRRQLPTCY